MLPESQIAALAAGRINDVPVMQGAAAFEGRAFLRGIPIDEQEYRARIPTLATFFGKITTLATFFGKDPDGALSTYPLDEYETPWDAVAVAPGDSSFACIARRGNTLLSDWVPTYAYEFADPNASQLGATHSAKVRHLLNLVASSPDTPLPPESQELAKTM